VESNEFRRMYNKMRSEDKGNFRRFMSQPWVIVLLLYAIVMMGLDVWRNVPQ